MNIPRKILSKVQQQRGRSDVGTQGICQGRHPGKLHKATLHNCTFIFKKRRQTTFFYKVFFLCIRESRTFTCSSCNIVIQPTGRRLYQYSVWDSHHPHNSALGTKIVPVQCQQNVECLGLSVWLRLAGAGASQQGLTHVTRILFLCHQTSGIRISYHSSTESHLAPSLDYIFLFIPKWTLFLSLPDIKVRCPYSQSCSLGLPPKMMVGSKSVYMT